MKTNTSLRSRMERAADPQSGNPPFCMLFKNSHRPVIQVEVHDFIQELSCFGLRIRRSAARKLQTWPRARKRAKGSGGSEREEIKNVESFRAMVKKK